MAPGLPCEPLEHIGLGAQHVMRPLTAHEALGPVLTLVGSLRAPCEMGN